MKQRKYFWIKLPLIIILFFLAIVFYIRYKNQPRFWFCSPIEPRGNDFQIWKDKINPDRPVSQIDGEFFNQFTISSNEEKFTIDFPNKKPNENPFAFELLEFAFGEKVEISSGTLEFSSIGIMCPDVNQNKQKHVEFRFYNTRLQPMSEEGVIELENNEVILSRYNYPSKPFPKVMFIFRYEGIENLMLNNFRIYDSRTHNPLLAESSSSSGEKSCCFECDIPLWYDTPVDVVIDASYGPVKTYEFPPVKGEGFAEENFECRLLDVFENVNVLFSTSKEIYKKQWMPQDKLGQRFYFICQPQAWDMPVTFELLDKEGNRLDTRGGKTSTYTHDFRLFEPLEKVAFVRANYRPNRYRIVCHLPFIPGLPEENTDIKNLFDVRIPYANFQNASSLVRFVQQTLQLNNLQVTGNIPVGSINNIPFPIEFTEVTVRDIAKIFATGGTLKVDIKNDQLELKYPIPLITRIKRFITAIFHRKHP